VADEKLAESIWRTNGLKKSDDIIARAPCLTCSDLLSLYRTHVSAYSKATDDLKGLLGDDLKLMFARAEEFSFSLRTRSSGIYGTLASESRQTIALPAG
jgi:hypothetical protein